MFPRVTSKLLCPTSVGKDDASSRMIISSIAQRSRPFGDELLFNELFAVTDVRALCGQWSLPAI
jgi:hypothetical protein